MKKPHLPTVFRQLLLCLVLLAFASAATASASRFDDGFQGLAWGISKDELPDLGLKPAALNNIYKKGPSSAFFGEGSGKLLMAVEGVALLSIFLNFFDQRLYGADMVFTPGQRQKAYDIIVKETGQPCQQTASGDRWQTPKVSIVLTDRELMVVARDFDPDKTGAAPADKDAACCPGKG